MQEYVSSVRTLLKVAQGRSLDQSIARKDSPLSRQISYGVLRNFYYLSACLEQLLNKPMADKHQDLELLIMAGIYSIDELNRPAHASVNFAVESTVPLKKAWAKKLVNGVLRNYQRKRDQIREALEQDREAQTNHPEWLTNLLASAYPDHLDAIIVANQNEPPMTLRVNLAIHTREAYLDKLASKDMAAKAGTLCQTSIYLEQPVPAEHLPGFAEGEVSIQDEASQLIVELLNLEPGQKILDACAAPGGKTCAILEQDESLRVCAIDQDANRTNLIKDNLNRLGLEAEVRAEALEQHTSNELYDRILLDVPCSAVGIIRRHPDIKLLRLESDIAKLVATQEELLAKAWTLLKANGEIVYSTCSVLPSENREVVAAFLAKQPDAQLLPIEFESDQQSAIAHPEGLQLLPTNHGADGFFFSKLKKVEG